MSLEEEEFVIICDRCWMRSEEMADFAAIVCSSMTGLCRFCEKEMTDAEKKEWFEKNKKSE